MKPHFFIVTPSYNQGCFIKETIDSVLNQQGDFEVTYWVIDGGSTDNTLSILKKYGKQINWVSEKDHGQADALNKALTLFFKQSSNHQNYFAFINSDDYYLPQTFQTVADKFNENPSVQWLVGDAVIVNKTGQEFQAYVRLYKRLFRNPVLKSNVWILNYIPQPSTFIRLDTVKFIGKFNQKLKYTFDYDYWLRLVKQVGYPLFCSLPLSAFRIHGESKGGSQFIHQFDEEIATVKHYNQNRLVITIHQTHNWFIKHAYKKIK